MSSTPTSKIPAPDTSTAMHIEGCGDPAYTPAAFIAYGQACRDAALEEAAGALSAAAVALESGKRPNQVDRHTASVLAAKATAICKLKGPQP